MGFPAGSQPRTERINRANPVGKGGIPLSAPPPPGRSLDPPRFGTVGRIGRSRCAVGWFGKPPLPAVTLLGGAVGMSTLAQPCVAARMGSGSDFFPNRSPTPDRYVPEERRFVGVGVGSAWIEYSTIPNPMAAPVRAVQSPPDSPVSILVSTAPPAAPPRRVSPLRKAGSCSTARPTPAAALSYPESCPVWPDVRPCLASFPTSGFSRTLPVSGVPSGPGLPDPCPRPPAPFSEVGPPSGLPALPDWSCGSR